MSWTCTLHVTCAHLSHNDVKRGTAGLWHFEEETYLRQYKYSFYHSYCILGRVAAQSTFPPPVINKWVIFEQNSGTGTFNTGVAKLTIIKILMIIK